MQKQLNSFQSQRISTLNFSFQVEVNKDPRPQLVEPLKKKEETLQEKQKREDIEKAKKILEGIIEAALGSQASFIRSVPRKG